jgi:hypothetical protein
MRLLRVDELSVVEGGLTPWSLPGFEGFSKPNVPFRPPIVETRRSWSEHPDFWKDNNLYRPPWHMPRR